MNRDEFITNNLKLVCSRVKRLNNGIFDDDLYQEGVIGLIVAIDRFDTSKGFKFSTFAVLYIDGYIKTYKNKDSLIKPKRKESDGWEHKKVISIESLISGETGEEEIRLCDTLVSDEHTEKEMIENLAFDNVLTHLTEDERVIVSLAQSECNQRTMGKIVGLSQAQVSRKLKRIKEKYISYSQPIGVYHRL